MTLFTLRQATANDFPICLGIRNEAMREYIEQIRGWDDGYEERRFRGHFQPDKTRVILSDDRVIGFLGVREEGDALYVAQMYLIPEYQGQGIGTALMRELLAEGRPVVLKVTKLNTGARRLYERLGFRVTSEDADSFRMRAEPGARFHQLYYQPRHRSQATLRPTRKR